MAGLRDVLIHGCFGIDTSRLWSGAKEFASEMCAQIEALPEYKLVREKDARL